MTSIRTPEYRRMLARLRHAREAAALKQAEVGRKMGKPQSFVSKVENGERRIDPTELAQLARVYGRDIGWFLEPSDNDTEGA
jgi:transcriptional regulator with XRE-family HTH domain